VALVGLAGFAVGTTATIVLTAAIGYRGIVLGTAVGYFVTFVVFASRTRAVLPEWSWRRFAAVELAPLSAATIAAVIAAAVSVRFFPEARSSLVVAVALIGLKLGLAFGCAFGARTIVGGITRTHFASCNSVEAET
jgi:hypothetical protein